jgi:hypothetical protein
MRQLDPSDLIPKFQNKTKDTQSLSPSRQNSSEGVMYLFLWHSQHHPKTLQPDSSNLVINLSLPSNASTDSSTSNSSSKVNTTQKLPLLPDLSRVTEAKNFLHQSNQLYQSGRYFEAEELLKIALKKLNFLYRQSQIF